MAKSDEKIVAQPVANANRRLRWRFRRHGSRRESSTAQHFSSSCCLLDAMIETKNPSVVTTTFAFLFLTFLVSCKYNELDPNSDEGSEAQMLRLERYSWLDDGCPQPPVAGKYMQVGRGDTNYTYSSTLIVSNFLDGFGIASNRAFHGLFATKGLHWLRTLVITTTGDIIAIEDSGQVRLVEMCDIYGQQIKPR